jgi:hypothetical protein
LHNSIINNRISLVGTCRLHVAVAGTYSAEYRLESPNVCTGLLW